MAISHDMSCVAHHGRIDKQPLSGFKARCLLKSISDLHEQMQIAVLGADLLTDAVQTEGLDHIRVALHPAETQIAFAHILASH